MSAAPASLDRSFSGDGIRLDNPYRGDDAVKALVTQPDGKIVVAGTSAVVNREGGINSSVGYVIRYGVHGERDATFGRNGIAFANFGSAVIVDAVAVRVQNDGKVVAVFAFNPDTGQPGAGVARFTRQGHLDRTFSYDGKVTLRDIFPAHMTIQYDGKIVIAGSYGRDFAVERLTTHGGRDTSFSGDGIRRIPFFSAQGVRLYASAAHVHELYDGRIVVTGNAVQSRQDGEVDRIAIARIWPHGALDKTFSGDGRVLTSLGWDWTHVTSSVIQRDGRIVVAGMMGGSNGYYSVLLARYTSTGALDRTFGGGDGWRLARRAGSYENRGFDVALQSDGRIVIVGDSDEHLLLARFLPRGGLDQTFGKDGTRTLSVGAESGGVAVSVAHNGRIVVGGVSWTRYGVLLLLARFEGS